MDLYAFLFLEETKDSAGFPSYSDSRGHFQSFPSVFWPHAKRVFTCCKKKWLKYHIFTIFGLQGVGSSFFCKCNMLDCWFLYICFLLLSLTERLQLTLLDSSQLENWKILLALCDLLCFRVTWQLIYIIIYTYSINLLYFVLPSISLLLASLYY